MSESTLPEKPRTVDWAVACIWISTGLLGLWALIAIFLPRLLQAGDLATNLITIAVLVWIALKIKAGKSWAWVVYVGMYIFSVLCLGLSSLLFPEILSQSYVGFSGLTWFFSLAQYGAQTVALVLLLLKPSRDWFNAQRPQKDKGGGDLE